MSARQTIDHSSDITPCGSFFEMSTPTQRLSRLTDLATPFAVRVVATLRVPDLIAAGTDRLEALAERTGTDSDALGRLLRYLAHQGLFTEPTAGVFGLTETGQLLCETDPGGHRGYLELDGLGTRLELAFAGLLHSVRTGQQGYSEVHGRPLWADLDVDPQRQRHFDELMASQQARTAPQVTRLYDWDPVAHVVDVGGGNGALLSTLLAAYPRLRGTLVDRQGPAAAAAERFTRDGLAGRAQVQVGDFFEPLPRGAGVYVVSRVLTDWGDQEAITVLRRCREAAAPDGRVLIVEVLPASPHVPHRTRFDLQMLVTVGGRERSLDDFGTLATAAGLAVTATIHGADGLVLLECAPRPDPG